MKRRWPGICQWKRRGGLGLLVLTAAVGQSACSRDQTAGSAGKTPGTASRSDMPGADTGLARQALAEIVAAAAPDGWKRTGQVQHYTPESLYKKIDGRAELFLAYDVIGLTFASFEDAADPERFIDVSVYDMGTPTNAFGVFSVERSPADPPVSLGRAAYRADANVYVWKGQYYVKIMASDATDAFQRISMDLARKVTDRLPDTGQRVWGRTALPQADRVPNSVRYFQVDAMGLDFMRNTYTAQYRKGDAVVTVFLSRQATPPAAQAALAGYIKHAKKYGNGVAHLTTNGVDVKVCDMGNTYDIIFQKGRLIAGVTAVNSRPLALQTATGLWNQLPDE